ncbi:MAG: type II toxin-antitoxin system VapC family toxin [Beijerinckiaceae bacterium]
MSLILDAHIVILLALDHPRLSASVRDLLSRQIETMFCSLAQLWEVEIKIAAGRMPEVFDFSKEIATLGLELVLIEPADAIRAARLPRHHGDPFDRMLISQAITRDLTILTHDRAFEPYAVPVVWA